MHVGHMRHQAAGGPAGMPDLATRVFLDKLTKLQLPVFGVVGIISLLVGTTRFFHCVRRSVCATSLSKIAVDKFGFFSTTQLLHKAVSEVTFFRKLCTCGHRLIRCCDIAIDHLCRVVDWNPSGANILSIYKHGSSRIGPESYRHAPQLSHRKIVGASLMCNVSSQDSTLHA